MPAFLYYIRFLRARDWFYIIGVAYLGFFFAIKDLVIIDFLVLSFIASLYVAHGYSINLYFDFKSGEDNFLRESGKSYNRRIALYISVALILINLLVSFFYSKMVFLLVILGGTVSFLYSSPYTRFKKRPALNIVLNSTGFAILFLIGYIANKSLSFSALHLAGYIWLGVAPSQIIHLMGHGRTEGNWNLPMDRSIKLWHLSLLVWLIWSFLCFFIFENMTGVFYLTLVFSVIQVSIMQVFRSKGRISIDGILTIRKTFKIISIIFGLILIYFLVQ